MQTYGKKWIQEGMAVAHKENPGCKMFVIQLVLEVRHIPNRSIKSEKKISGVLVHWWDECENVKDKKKLVEHRFHTREIVPWEIAEQGKDAIIKFLEDH